MLRRAVAAEFRDAGRLREDPAFAGLHDRADLQALLRDLDAPR